MKKLSKAKQRFLDQTIVTEGCWLWKKDSRRFWMEGRGSMHPRRAAWFMWMGVPEPRYFIYSGCGNAACVRPDHLRACSKMGKRIYPNGSVAEACVAIVDNKGNQPWDSASDPVDEASDG